VVACGSVIIAGQKFNRVACACACSLLKCQYTLLIAGDRQAGSAVDRLDRNSPDTRHDARLIHYVTQAAF
jgi:hypothetical protein